MASRFRAQTTPERYGESRRQFRPSVKLRWPVQLEVAGPAEVAQDGAHTSSHPDRHRGRTRGIGIGGAFIETEVSLQPGQSIRLWLYPPVTLDSGGPAVLRLHAVVRWISDGRSAKSTRGVGVAFGALTAADEIHLHGYFSASLKMV